MNNILKSKQNGFAIIEALIAFLLLGIGVAALLYLQGNLMSGSSASKARAEAMDLAKDRIEVLRNYIEKDKFEGALYSAVHAELSTPIPGINAEFSVNYELNGVAIDTGTTEEAARLSSTEPERITVEVRWDSSETDSGGNPINENVVLETTIYFKSPIITSGIDSGNEGAGGNFPPLVSPWITGVEGEDPNPPPSSGFDPREDVLLREDPDDLTSDALITVDIKTYYNIVDSTTSYNNVEVLAFVDTDGDSVADAWEVVLTSFGGIVHKLQGEIIIDSGANTTLGDLTDDLKILASPPSYCVFPICEGDDCTVVDRAKYVCYVPGDCTYQDEFAAALNGCPAGFIPPPDDGFPDLNGGWYGRVGNFGIAIHPDDKVCTLETDIDAPKTNLTPSRNYVTYRCADDLVGGECLIGSIIGNEGINTPYSNQNFLITRKNTNCDTVSGSLGVPLLTSQIEGTPLVGEKIFDTNGPTYTWEKNIVLPENSCGLYLLDADGDLILDGDGNPVYDPAYDPLCLNPDSNPYLKDPVPE